MISQFLSIGDSLTADLRLVQQIAPKCGGRLLTGVHIVEMSSSDALDGSASPGVVTTRDMLAAVPTAVWIIPDDGPVAASVAEIQAAAIGAVTADGVFPMTAFAAPGLSYQVSDDRVMLRSDGRAIGLFEDLLMPVHRRLLWFLDCTKTLSVQIVTPARHWVSSITAPGQLPCLAAINGSLTSPASSALVERATKWSRVHTVNHSLFAGHPLLADHHYRIYSATPESYDIPERLEYRGSCLGCDSSERSQEHCVPNWIARKFRSIPVTAPVFCQSCNNYFGDVLENPVATAFRQEPSPEMVSGKIFHMWAIKTALTLSAASDILIQPTWMKELRKGGLPTGFRIFASTKYGSSAGYSFGVTQFSRTTEWTDSCLFSFWIDRLAFIVLRTTEDIDVKGLNEIYPNPSDTTDSVGRIDLVQLHRELLESITGERMTFDRANPKVIRSRQPK